MALNGCGMLLGLGLLYGDRLELTCLVGDVDLYVLGLRHELCGILLDEEVVDDHACVIKSIGHHHNYYYTGE